MPNGYSLILSIPHSSTFIPSLYYYHPRLYRTEGVSYNRNPFFFGAAERRRKLRIDLELGFMTDWYTDELFDRGLGPAVKAEVSRLYCDVERFRDDEKESMSRVGMGVCYTKDFDGEILRDVPPEEKKRILERYYDPYHRALTTLVGNALDKGERPLILDCHSFYPEPLPYEESNPDARHRPDISIGTDDFHTPEKLTEKLTGYFTSLGYSVALNSPFSGSLVPLAYYRRDRRVKSVMIEINRKLYLMNRDGGRYSWSQEKSPGFYILQKEIEELEKILAGK